MRCMAIGAPDRTAPTSLDDPLARGDAAAEREDWPAAVTAWKRALSSAARDDAIARLQWFIAWRTDRPIEQARTRLHRKPLELFLGFLACCLFATAAVFVTQQLSGVASDIAMVVAWIFVVLAATLSLLYARYSDPEPGAASHLGERQVRSLADRASTLATTSGPATRQQ